MNEKLARESAIFFESIAKELLTRYLRYFAQCGSQRGYSVLARNIILPASSTDWEFLPTAAT